MGHGAFGSSRRLAQDHLPRQGTNPHVFSCQSKASTRTGSWSCPSGLTSLSAQAAESVSASSTSASITETPFRTSSASASCGDQTLARSRS